MPGQSRHLAAAAHNEELAWSLLAAQEPEWAAVLVFYAALHLVDSYFALTNIHPRNHEMRKEYIQRTAQLRQIFADYRVLETRSRDARYSLIRISSGEVESLIDNELQAIKTAVEPAQQA